MNTHSWMTSQLGSFHLQVYAKFGQFPFKIPNTSINGECTLVDVRICVPFELSALDFPVVTSLVASSLLSSWIANTLHESQTRARSLIRSLSCLNNLWLTWNRNLLGQQRTTAKRTSECGQFYWNASLHSTIGFLLPHLMVVGTFLCLQMSKRRKSNA